MTIKQIIKELEQTPEGCGYVGDKEILYLLKKLDKAKLNHTPRDWIRHVFWDYRDWKDIENDNRTSN